ncbi:DnaJ homolog subfamily C member 17 [Fistulifera solaris]|uniref:DnaJ homolog subfamily C member 17 n=1 Tax=Fistulifera solaris TaxID=1519565 RepID=A0A1Z5KS81_FISSO|nr:DnaJ homolog subfamily C member 17 [Fistulifera solaris]|eukprot:GAX29173.1 DnaJ homolog subfamily C member 17 [Fistulifera solaris]
MASGNKDFPKEDPYDVLGVQPTDDAATINKAYRKLALQLHPDKIQQFSAKEQELAAERFQKIQSAKAFLTEPEYAKAREKYDLQRASQLRRKQVEAERTKSMSEKRKRMRDELAEQEKDARQRKVSRPKEHHSKDKVRDLQKEGEQLRQQYADKEAAKKVAEMTKASNEDRQIRLKWSRKKLKISPTEHSIAELMRQFGSVETVEFLGSKGNAALVTFTKPDSCRPCVDMYAESEEMRASYVGKRKEDDREETASLPKEKVAKDWKIQRAVEREKLLREMELEETTSKSSPKRARRKSPYVFPPPLPGDKNRPPWQILQEQEALILKNYLSPEQIQNIQIKS